MARNDKPQTAADITAEVESRMRRDGATALLCDVVADVAKAQAGKRITKRFETALRDKVRAVMGDNWTVHYSADTCALKVAVWTQGGGVLPYDERASFTIGRPIAWHNSEPCDVVNLAWIVEHNTSEHGAAARYAKMREALASGKPAQWAAAFAKEHAADLATYAEHYASTAARYGYTAEEAAGHDLWLTRSGSGSGFWDRGSDPAFGRLDEAASRLHVCDAYRGDSGWLHLG